VVDTHVLFTLYNLVLGNDGGVLFHLFKHLSFLAFHFRREGLVVTSEELFSLKHFFTLYFGFFEVLGIVFDIWIGLWFRRVIDQFIQVAWNLFQILFTLGLYGGVKVLFSKPFQSNFLKKRCFLICSAPLAPIRSSGFL
jgi:hypothetical protein